MNFTRRRFLQGTAIDRGVTFMDNCWDYKNGECERRMGKAVADTTLQALSAPLVGRRPGCRV